MTHRCGWTEHSTRSELERVMPRARRRFVYLTALMCTAAAPASAEQLFDNWNTGACGFTDIASFTIDRSFRVQRIDVWYRWRRNETAVRYTAMRGNEVIANGELARTECDPYQEAWCVARVEPNVRLEPGTYTFRTERARICQNAASGGLGFIRAYGAGP